MPIQITYFVHGTTVDNEQGISSGWFDAELSELGKEQSVKLRELTKDKGIEPFLAPRLAYPLQAKDRLAYVANKKFDVVFCSDLKRAVDSAHLAFEGLAPIITDARLRECNYGTFNAKPSEIVEPMQENMITQRFPEGESYEDVKNRIADFLNFLKQDYDGKSVAIVGHKAPQLALGVLLKSKTWEQAFEQDWRKTKSWQPGWEYTVTK